MCDCYGVTLPACEYRWIIIYIRYDNCYVHCSCFIGVLIGGNQSQKIRIYFLVIYWNSISQGEVFFRYCTGKYKRVIRVTCKTTTSK